MLYALLECDREGQQWGAEAQSQGKGYSEQQGSGYFDYSSQCLTHHSLWLEDSWREHLHSGVSVHGSFLGCNFFVFNLPINSQGQLLKVYTKFISSSPILISHIQDTLMNVIKASCCCCIMIWRRWLDSFCHVINLAVSHTFRKEHQ